jgi:uncharacterized protein YjbJ (UPF0337 family)
LALASGRALSPLALSRLTESLNGCSSFAMKPAADAPQQSVHRTDPVSWAKSLVSYRPKRHAHRRNNSSPQSLSGTHLQREIEMDWNRVEGNWKQVKGKVKEKWGNLTDDDLTAINGQRDQLEGKIQERYGLAKDKVRKDVDDWYNAQTW